MKWDLELFEVNFIVIWHCETRSRKQDPQDRREVRLGQSMLDNKLF